LNLVTLALSSARYYWRTNLAVTLGVAAAVAVLAGALVVGDSVRGSLRDIALGRLGHTDQVLSSMTFFRQELAEDVRQGLGASAATPLIVADAFVTLESSGRRASKVIVYGVDDRFWSFHGLELVSGVMVSPALASEVGAKEGDVLLTRLQKPSEVPIESLFGRKDEVGRTVRLILAGVLPRDRLGEFSIKPQQGDVRAVFAPLSRLQRDLAVPGQANTILIAGGQRSDAGLRSALRLEDLGVKVSAADTPRAIAVDSSNGILSEPLETAARAAGGKLQLTPTPVFTYLANTIRKGDRQIPYSLITATDLSALPAGLPSSAASGRVPPPAADAIVINEWAARELAAAPGDRLDVDYYLWDPTAGLTTKTAQFIVADVVPIAGLAADRRLAPDYPGITGANSLADWDPPFPIDLSRVRPVDERYWDDHRTTPKAFISYERGRDLWRSRYGAVTSLRFRLPDDADPAASMASLAGELRSRLSPNAMGLALFPARAAALEASRGATDFGEYFTYFSFFLMVSALMLTVLFFKLGIEQRLRQIGILRAAGYPMSVIRRLLLSEAAVLAVVGALIGIAGAIVYGRVIVYGLGTWWVGAVGTTRLELHVQPLSLVLGALGGVVAAIVCVLVSLRAVARVAPRVLLTSQSLDVSRAPDERKARRRRYFAAACGVLAVALLALGFIRPSAQAGAFFGGGALLLVASLLWLAGWLRRRDARSIAGRGSWAVSRLGFRGAASRPARSVLSAALIASAAFIIVSVGAFRRDGGDLTRDQKSGTGGYVLFAESELPLLHNPNEKSGRDDLNVQAAELSDVRFTRFRVKPGEDVSCLNLYRPTNPTLIAPEASFADGNRFTFAGSMASTDAERANPWLLLQRRFDDGAIPVVGDATSMQYVLHLGVGDTFAMDAGGERPIVLRFVGALQDSVLQGEVILSEENFVKLFPQQQGYRLFLIDAPSVEGIEAARALAGVVERELQPLGLDATVTSERLASFHQVENTYLSTFQALGGLGLLLGTIGLATVMFRNVLERRRELALLRAVGYDSGHMTLMIVAEAALLVGAGMAAGAGCAAIAIAPAWLGRGGSPPNAGLLLLLAAVVVSGIVSSAVATRAALRGRMLDALRAE
jgi:ABC-type lipoprotein release transport system permease subunit